MIAAAGASAAFAWSNSPGQFSSTPHWGLQWLIAFALLIASHVAADRLNGSADRRLLWSTLATEALAILWLVALYPTFLVTSLLVVVAWQIAWALPLRSTLWASAALAATLVVMKCTGQTTGMSLLILLSGCAFQLFAVAAAHLARSESEARAILARTHAELQAAHVLLAGASRMSERLRISRDLHDALGHSLTTLTLQLDVASRLTQGPAAEHLGIARQTASSLLDEVRRVVGQIRVAPLDLRATLEALTQGVDGMTITLLIPEELPPLDAPRADVVFRCVQEVITNAIRHSRGTELTIELRIAADGGVSVEASDNGVGGELNEGNGLRGMRERFEALGGRLTAVATEAGFAVRGALPAVDLPQ
jgi:signal transduction histidine kinase